MAQSRHFKVGALILAVGLISVTALGLSSEGKTGLFAVETPVEYTMTFSESHNRITETDPSVTLSAYTDAGSIISCSYGSTTVSAGYWGQFFSVGYFGNTTAINGLKSITLVIDGDTCLDVSYGWSSTFFPVASVTPTVASSGTYTTFTYDFGGERPSYFKLTNLKAFISVVSMSLTYACVASENPYYAGTEGLVMATNDGGNSYYVRGYSGSSQNVTINSTYRGKPVTSIGPGAFSSNKTVVSISLPSTITSIGSSAFENASSLTTINFPSSLTTIGSNAFMECEGLSSVSIPASVTDMGDSVFASCTGINEFVVDTNNANYSADGRALFNKDKTSLLAYAGNSGAVYDTIPSTVTTIGNRAFYGQTKLTSLTLPSSVESVGDYSISDCSGLTSLNLSSSLRTIGQYAFANDSNLTSIILPNNVRTIGLFAFTKCDKITTINFPATVSEIGTNPFYLCSSLASFAVDATNANFSTDGDGRALFTKDKTSLLAYANGSGTTYDAIPSTVTNIGTYAFTGSTIVSITIPSTVFTIEDKAFQDCEVMTTIDLSTALTSIGKSAFQKCSQLQTIFISSTVETVGAYAFRSCNTSLVISCGAASQPSGWNSYWNISGLSVIWGASKSNR